MKEKEQERDEMDGQNQKIDGIQFGGDQCGN